MLYRISSWYVVDNQFAIKRYIYIEKKFFNNDICPCCGNPLRDWEINCKGERGYLCEICGYHTWVSYKTVDKKYRRNGGTVR